MKRGNTSTLAPEVEIAMERLWTHSAVPRDEVAQRLNERFGTTFEGRNIEWHARRRGWARELMIRSSTHPAVIEDRLFTRSWLRWAEPKPTDNPVRRVAPGTHKANGFRMGGQ